MNNNTIYTLGKALEDPNKTLIITGKLLEVSEQPKVDLEDPNHTKKGYIVDKFLLEDIEDRDGSRDYEGVKIIFIDGPMPNQYIFGKGQIVFYKSSAPEHREKESKIMVFLEKEHLRTYITEKIESGELVKHNLENGNLESINRFTDYALDGIQEYYHEDGVTLAKRENYVNGVLEGESLEYYPEGTLYLKTLYVNGKANGDREKRYTDGKIWFKDTMINDVRQGLLTVWNESGKLWLKADYKDGVYHGNLVEWDEQERVVREEVYVEGTADVANSKYYRYETVTTN